MGSNVTQIGIGKSTYISTSLTKDQIDFLQVLDDHEILYFSLDDIGERLGFCPSNLNDLAENLNQKGFLNRIERGKYTRPQFNDPYVLGSFISKGGVVAYWSALHLHGLTDRFPNKVFIKTTMRKRNTNLFGTPIHFVSVKSLKLSGTVMNGYGDRSYRLADLETTILDCFDQPRYAGDWPDLLKAFSQTNLDANNLIEKAKLYNNAAVIKRMGYLADLLKKKELTPFIDFAKQKLGKKYTLFEPGGEDSGKFNSSWMLRLNITETAIIQIIENSY